MNFKSSRTYLVAMTVMVMLSACIKSESPKDFDNLNNNQKSATLGFEEAEANASFYIKGDAKGVKVEEVTSFDGATKDVRAIQYRFEVCLSDKAKNRELQNFNFNISSPEGESPSFSKDEATDFTGCLIWTETFNFDIGKRDPQPVLFLRKIKALSGSSRQGEVSFIFRLYPWAEVLRDQAFDSFYYLRDELRLSYRGEIQRLYSGQYDPRASLMHGEGEKTRLLISEVNYDLTAIPFSMIKKESQPDFEELNVNLAAGTSMNDLPHLRTNSNFVMMPEENNPRYTELLDEGGYPQREGNEENFFSDNPTFDGIKVDLELNIKLAQPISVVNGTAQRDQLSGRYRVLPYLYSGDFNPGGDRVLLNPQMESLVSESTIDQKGELNVVFRGILPFTPTAGRVMLALQITPMDNRASEYEVIEELFTVGNFDQLIGKQKLKEHPIQFNDKPFDFVEFAKSSSGYDDALRDSHLREAEPYNYTLLNVKFNSIDPGETANRRTVNFQATTCISDVFNTTKIAAGAQYLVKARHFLNNAAEKEDEEADNEGRDPVFKPGDYKDVELYNEEIEGDKIKVDANGCITFMDQVRHKYYRTERLMRRKYFIKAKNDNQDFVKELVIYMNPWDEKFGTLGTDARSVSQTFLSQLQTRDKIEPRFYIQDFRYETLRFRYEIDKNMNLIVKKTVLFRMQPRVLRYSNVLQGINSIFPIRDGIYLLKIAYQKDYLDPAAEGLNLRSELIKRTLNPGGDDEVKPDQNLEEGQVSYTTGALLERYNEPGLSEQEKESQGLYSRAEGVSQNGYSPAVSNGYDPNKRTSLSIVKKLVRVNSGAIVTPIEFSVEDLRLLRIRSQVFVQLETINQTRLQIVNMASRLIENAMGLVKATDTPISNLDKEVQQENLSLKLNALDTLARNIPDDLNYTKEDASELEAVFQKEEVIMAFRPFLSGAELSSVPHMLQEVDPEQDMMFSAIQGAFLKDEERVEKLREQAEEVYAESLALRAETTAPASQRHYEPVERTTDQGAEYFERDYTSSDEFNNRCGEGYVGYDQCFSDHEEGMGTVEADKFCKCFDNISKDYEDLDTFMGSALNSLQERASELALQSEYLSASSIVELARQRSREFFGSITETSQLSKLLLNDFTLAQADADISDLNYLCDNVEEGVDISKRTFVGPLTFLNNSNGGALRPTDNLDEAYCVTDDCNSLATDPLDKYTAIQNYDYERSPYHGSIAHYHKKHVDDFINGTEVMFDGEIKEIPSYKDFKENKRKTHEVQSLLSNFVDEYNLNYVSLSENPEALKAYICDDPTKVDFENNLNGCLVDYTDKTVSKSDLFSTYRSLSRDRSVNRYHSSFKHEYYQHGVNESFLKNIVKKQDDGLRCTNKVIPASYAKFDESEYAKFCSLMTYGVFAKNLSEVTDTFIDSVKNGEVDYGSMNGGLLASMGFNFFNSSIQGVNNQLDPFFKDGDDYTPNLKFFISKVYSSCLEHAARGENNEPLHVERKYRIEETGRYYYLGGKALNITLGQQVGVSHKNDSNKLHKMDIGFLTRLLPDTIKGYGYSYSRGEGISANESLNIQQGTFLVMQNAEFDVELKRYEQCMVFRWSEDFMRENKDVFFYNPMSKSVRGKGLDKNGIEYIDYITNKLTEGLMVCSGDIEETPIAVRETYYYFTQHFTEGDMQDRADIHNHPWLLSLRGVREFEAFLMSTLSDHEVADEMPENKMVHAEELVGMRTLLNSDIAAENLNGESFEPFDKFRRNSWPLTRLINTYRKVSPTFPGLYTQLDRHEYETKQWPWKGSVPGEKFTDDASEECMVPAGEDAR